MADDLDPTINMLLTRFPAHFKIADQTPGSVTSSSAQASAAQSETDQKPKGTKDGKNSSDGVHKDNPDCVKERFRPISLAGRGLSPTLTDNVKSGSSGDSGFGHGFTAEVASEVPASSRSEKTEAELSLAELIELTRKDDQSSGKEMGRSSSDLRAELQALSPRSPIKRSVSPPLGYALARRASVLSSQKQVPSWLRNETHRYPTEDISSATDEKAISEVGKGIGLAKADEITEKAHLPAKLKATTEGATEAKITRQAMELTNDDPLVPPITLLESSPGCIRFKINGQIPGKIPGKPSSSLTYCDPGAKISAHVLAKVPDEFKNLYSDVLRKFFDVASFPGIRETVLAFKHKLAQAGELVEDLNWPNRLLVTLVDAQIEEEQKGATHVVDESEIKTIGQRQILPATSQTPTQFSDTQEEKSAKHLVDTSDFNSRGCKQSMLSATSQPAQLPVTKTFEAALLEFQKILINPTHDINAARRILALSKGIKLDPALAIIVMDFYKDLLPYHYSSKMASHPNGKDKLVSEHSNSSKLEVLDKGKCKENNLLMKGTTLRPIEGHEEDRPVGGSPIASGQGNENEAANAKIKANGKKNKGKRKSKGKGKEKECESPLDDAAPDKGKGKDREMYMEGSAVGKGECKKNELPIEDVTMGKGKAEEGNVPMEDPATSEDKVGGSDEQTDVHTPGTGDQHEDTDNLLNLDLAKMLVSTGRVEQKDIRVKMRGVYDAIMDKAKDLFLDPQSIGFLKSMGLQPNDPSKSTTSNSPAHYRVVRRDLTQFPLSLYEQSELIIFLRAYEVMENKIRPQTASIAEVETACLLFSDAKVFAALIPLVRELSWNRAVFRHPSNPMITSILQCTQNHRSTNGYHHSSGISVAPLWAPEFPGLPPGLAPTAPLVNMQKVKQPLIGRGGVPAPMEVKLPFEDPSDDLTLTAVTTEALVKRGMPLEEAQLVAGIVATQQSTLYLREKAKKRIVGGTAADLVVARQNKMAGKGFAHGVERQNKTARKGVASGTGSVMEMLAMRQMEMFD